VIRRLLMALVAVSLTSTPAVEAKPAPPKHHLSAKAKKRHALDRKRAAARRRAAAKRKAMEQAAAQEAPWVPVVAPVVQTPPAEEAPVVEAPVVAPAVPLGHSIGVTARDTPRFFLQLSRTEVAAGVVGVQVANGGEDGHDLHIESLAGTLVEAWDELASGDAPVVKDVLLAPGVYRVYCSLPGHAAAGMDTRITAVAG
jgi:hypothetical protein